MPDIISDTSRQTSSAVQCRLHSMDISGAMEAVTVQDQDLSGSPAQETVNDWSATPGK